MCQIYIHSLFNCHFPRLEEHHGQQTIGIEGSMLLTWIHCLMWKTHITQHSMRLYNSHFNQGQTAPSISAISSKESYHPLMHWGRHLLLHVSLVNYCTYTHTHTDQVSLDQSRKISCFSSIACSDFCNSLYRKIHLVSVEWATGLKHRTGLLEWPLNPQVFVQYSSITPQRLKQNNHIICPTTVAAHP